MDRWAKEDAVSVDPGNITLRIFTVRSGRRSISMEIRGDDKGTYVLVRAPRRSSDEVIKSFVSKHSDWVMAKAASYQKRAEEEKKLKENIRILTEDEIEKLKKEGKEYFTANIPELAEMMGVTYGKITVRMQKTRWGSCTKRGDLNFNCLLMLAPEDVRKNVMVHELCHRLAPDHGKRFYALMEKYMPDFREQEKWLKENGRRLMISAGLF